VNFNHPPYVSIITFITENLEKTKGENLNIKICVYGIFNSNIQFDVAIFHLHRQIYYLFFVRSFVYLHFKKLFVAAGNCYVTDENNCLQSSVSLKP
jgi:hypothetical protein